MYGAVSLAAPRVFGPLPAAEESEFVRKRVMLINELVQKQDAAFEKTPPGELFHLELSPQLDFSHPVESFVRRY